MEIGRAESGLEAAAVFQDVFPGVPFGEAKIEDFFAVLIGHTAKFGAEPVDKPGEFGKHGDLENSHAAHFALGPNTLVTGANP